MAKSITTPASRIRAALVLRRLSVRKLAAKHGVSDKTLYAVFNGVRPGNCPRVKRAVAEANRATEALAHV
ncbi:MAG: hypothetical protein HZA93_23745 [Verrucomicrobia bacterium]|nr:hypothetical protein [Verrucomicrobiota bacterium]